MTLWGVLWRSATLAIAMYLFIWFITGSMPK